MKSALLTTTREMEASVGRRLAQLRVSLSNTETRSVTTSDAQHYIIHGVSHALMFRARETRGHVGYCKLCVPDKKNDASLRRGRRKVG